jgi:rubrerythrin
LYDDAKKAAEANQDIEIPEVRICPVCGFTHIGEPPDRCPVCNAKKESFKIFWVSIAGGERLALSTRHLAPV